MNSPMNSPSSPSREHLKNIYRISEELRKAHQWFAERIERQAKHALECLNRISTTDDIVAAIAEIEAQKETAKVLMNILSVPIPAPSGSISHLRVSIKELLVELHHEYSGFFSREKFVLILNVDNLDKYDSVVVCNREVLRKAVMRMLGASLGALRVTVAEDKNKEDRGTLKAEMGVLPCADGFAGVFVCDNGSTLPGRCNDVVFSPGFVGVTPIGTQAATEDVERCLGLWLVRWIATLCGGDARLATATGEWTNRYEMLLPIAKQA